MKLDDIKHKAQQLKKQTITLYFSSRDARLPLHIKIIAVFIVAYALSPIDLIPDFIPIIGLLDDIIIIPLGLALIIKLTPPEIWPQLIYKLSKQKAVQPVILLPLCS